MNITELNPIGEIKPSNCFSFVVYSNLAPYVGDKIEIESEIYEVESVNDCTDDDEFEEGLSFSEVRVMKLSLDN